MLLPLKKVSLKKSTLRRQNRIKLQQWCETETPPPLSEWTSGLELASNEVGQKLLVICAHLNWPDHLQVCLDLGGRLNAEVQTTDLYERGLKNKPSRLTSFYKINALEMAIISAHFPLALDLIEKGATLISKEKTEISQNVLNYLSAFKISVSFDNQQETLLKNQLKKLIDKVLEWGWDFNRVPEYCFSDIQLASRHKCAPALLSFFEHPLFQQTSPEVREEIWQRLKDEFDDLDHKNTITSNRVREFNLPEGAVINPNHEHDVKYQLKVLDQQIKSSTQLLNTFLDSAPEFEGNFNKWDNAIQNFLIQRTKKKLENESSKNPLHQNTPPHRL